MKKVVLITILILLFIIIYLLQSNLFNWFNLSGVKPNLFVILVLTIGLFAGKKLGVILGIFFGIVIDCLIGKNIGVSAIMLGFIGFFGEFLDKNFSKDSRITMITMIAISTLVYEVGIIAFNYFINNSVIFSWYLIKTLIIELIYNSIITIIIYSLIIKFGFKLEQNFKENNILTRFF